MKPRNLVIALAAAVLLGGMGYALFRLGMDRGLTMAVPASGTNERTHGTALPASAIDPATGKKILYWHDPMVPGQKFDKPGKSPYMDMQLVPVLADNGDDKGTVAISPRVQQSLGVRTAEVETGTLSPAMEAVGSVAWNERDVALVQARSNGFVEKLFVRAPLDPVRKGQPLAEIYVPDWVSAQEEYLSARRIAGTGLGSILEGLQEGARQRMRLTGMTDDQIRLVESSGHVHARFTFSAPISGVVTELGVREGMTVMSGATLFRINGIDTVWVYAEVPENLAAQVRPGNAVQARTPSLPGITFKGRVNAILPEVNPVTRTLRARVELANPEGRLVAGMFATVNFASAAPRQMLMVPTEAVIRTGTRTVVIVMQGEGGFAPVDVETGMESADRTEIRSGLERGQKVVISGQFLIDSEASLRGTVTRMGDAPTPPKSSAGDAPPHGDMRGPKP